MDWYKKTEEDKKRIREYKEKKKMEFSNWLKDNRINHDVKNNGNHIQVQIQHHFYPGTGRYYNSKSNRKTYYPNFKDVNAFLDFLSKNVA